MAYRLRFAAAVSLLPFLALLSGCKPRPKQAVVVHVLRNLGSLYGSEMDRRILDFQGSNPRLPSGQPVVIQSETGDYKDMLQKQNTSSTGVDVIILDSASDVQNNPALQPQTAQATNICAGVKACPANIPAIIPSQVTGANRDAAQLFVSYLAKSP